MQQSTLNRALALANLVNLGIEPDRAIAISAQWSQRQYRQSMEEIVPTLRAARVDNGSAVDGDAAHLTVSFHYSVYPLLYRALAARHPEQTVFSLIGQQDASQRSALQHRAGTLGFHIEFVESGPQMVRRLRRAIDSGISAILLADIPWSRGEIDLDVRYRVPGGQFLGLGSLERLCGLIDPDYRVTLARRRGDALALECHGRIGLADAFARLGEALRDDPAEYERLHQFHHFFEFDAPRACAVSFEIGGTRYAVHGRSMKAWQVSVAAAEGLPAGAFASTDPALTSRFAAITHDDVDAVACI
jgi:hypothetical protein